jgi:conjugative relaxase-like TrwC/TraI family protein
MLTISKALSASQAATYHAKEFANADQRYYSQDQNVRGEWQGKLAERWGVQGAVEGEHFERLAQGQHPQTADQLVRHRLPFEYKGQDGKTVKSTEHRAGWDATFSAPKSVSLTALVGGDLRVREAHRESVRVALDELERYVQARIGGNNPAETTGKFIVAKFEHDTARPVGGYAAPQLHTHAVIFNVTERADGQSRALQPHELFKSQAFVTAVYQSELTFRLRQLGYEIEAGRSGAPEIKGYSWEYLEASSPRSQQIRKHLESRGLKGHESAEIAAHQTRDKKQLLSQAEVLALHRELAAQHGNQAERIIREAEQRRAEQDHDPQRQIKAAQEGVTFSRDKHFEREAVTDERTLLRDAMRRSMGEAPFADVQANYRQRHAQGEFIDRATPNSLTRLVTTEETLAAERQIIDQMREGQGRVEPIAADMGRIESQWQHLNESQRNVVRDVLESRDKIMGIQ